MTWPWSRDRPKMKKPTTNHFGKWCPYSYVVLGRGSNMLHMEMKKVLNTIPINLTTPELLKTTAWTWLQNEKMHGTNLLFLNSRSTHPIFGTLFSQPYPSMFIVQPFHFSDVLLARIFWPRQATLAEMAHSTWPRWRPWCKNGFKPSCWSLASVNTWPWGHQPFSVRLSY